MGRYLSAVPFNMTSLPQTVREFFYGQKSKHSRDKPKNALNGSGYNFYFGGSSSGKCVNERTSLQITAVYTCIRVIVEAIAGLPLHLYKSKSEGKEKAKTHPLYSILHDEPNPEMISFVFRETLMGHLLLCCNAE